MTYTITPRITDVLVGIATDYTDHMFNNGEMWNVEDGFALLQVHATFGACRDRGWSVDMALIETSRLHHSTFHYADSAW